MSLHEVEEAIKSANTNSTGGFLTKGYEEVLIRNLGTITTLDDLKQAVVRREKETKQTEAKQAAEAMPLLLGQVAQVRLGGPLTKRRCGGQRQTRGHFEHPETTQRRYRLADQGHRAGNREREADLRQGVTVHTEIFRQSAFIERAIKNVEKRCATEPSWWSLSCSSSSSISAPRSSR